MFLKLQISDEMTQFLEVIAMETYYGLIGQLNIGKSTLLSQFLSTKVSITSRKPHH